jgi:hypothetical protein
MAKHKAHVQQGDGEGFAGTGTRLDQSAAMQGKV